MRVFLDDTRPTPEGFVRVYWPEEAIAHLKTGQVELISLDYDLGDGERRTGYDVLVWIEEAVREDGITPPAIRIHSDHRLGRIKMQMMADGITAAVSA
jgi:hypothetical protein